MASAGPESTREIGELAGRFGLDRNAALKLQRLLELLTTDSEAPTALRDIPRAINDHLADSLVALEIPAVRTAASMVDIGSGAGMPGLPLAIALPGARVVLLESNHRKAQFIRKAARESGIANAEAAAARAESYAEGLVAFDLATVRAVADLAVVAEYAAPLLRLGGHLVAWRGNRDGEVEARAAEAARILGLEILEPVRVIPYPAARQRFLHLMVKVRETPDRFPRRPGMAAKRPLGGRTG
jgi:16S rRNA (guanine527-N7)-methyltransferase